ncbi:MAG: sensor histidine kinase, partial [Hyphomicrobium sp.]|nr:sensor histidine kinase [Hyphomicrobium sp.]
MRSLKSRLIMVAAVWIVAGVAFAGFLLTVFFKEFLVAEHYQHLHVSLDELERLIEFDAGRLKLHRPLSDPRYGVHLSGAYWEIQNGGSILARSRSLEGPMLKVPLDINEDAQIHNHRISGPTGELLLVERSRWFEQIPGQTRVIVGMDEKIIDSEMRRFNGALLWTLGGFATSLGVAASLLLAFAMKPFGALRQALARVRTGSASALGGSFPSEVQPLIDDLNNLLS